MMKFRIADTFTASLARLQVPEQKAAKITALDLQSDPSALGLQLHRLERSRDPAWVTLRAESRKKNVGLSHNAR